MVAHQISTQNTNRYSKKDALDRLSEVFKKKSCNFDQIVDEVFNLFKSNGIKREAARQLVLQLIKEQSIIPGKKHTFLTILENPTRRSIYSYIQEEKVAHYSKIKQELGIRSENMYRLHLESLENFGLLKSFQYGGIRLICSNDIDEDSYVCYYRLKIKKYYDIVNLLLNSEPLSIADFNLHLKMDTKYTVESLVKIKLFIENDKKYILDPEQREKVKGIIKHINEMKMTKEREEA